MEKKKFATKKQVIILSIIVIVVLAIIGCSQYGKHQKKVSACKGTCNYSPAGKTWSIPSTNKDGKYIMSKYFETQEQCIDYCLNQ